MKRPLLNRALLFSLAVTVLINGQTHAAQIEKNSSNTALNTTTSWVGGVVPGSSDIASYGTGAPGTGSPAAISNALGGPLSWQGILDTTAANVTISGTNNVSNTLTLGSSGIDMSSSGGNLTFNLFNTQSGANSVGSLVLGADQTWNVGAGRTLSISQLTSSGSGAITLAGTGTIAFGAAPFGTGAVNISDNIKLRPGQLTLTNAVNLNSDASIFYTSGNSGLFSLNGGLNLGSGTGTRTITVGQSITSAATAVIFGGAGTQIQGAGTLAFAYDSASGFSSVGVRIDNTVATAGLSVGPNVNLNLNGANRLSTTAPVAVTVNGQLSTNTAQTVGALTGTGTVTSGATAAGAVYTIDGGTSTATSTFTGNIINNAANAAGTVALTKAGANTQVLSGTNTYTGLTSVNGGTLTLDYSTNDTAKFGGALALGGGTLNLSGGTFAQTATATALNAGESTITLTSRTAPIALGAITRNAGSFLDLTAGGIATTTTGAASSLLTSTTGGIGVVGVVGGNDWAAKDAANATIVGLSTVNGYTNSTATTVGGDTDVVTDVAGTALSASTLRFNGAAARTVTATGGTLTLTQGGILVTPAVGNNLTTITGGTLKPGSNNALFIAQNNTANGLTIQSIVANGSAASSLTKAGAGLLTLSAANTYTGATYVDNGTLLVNGSTGAGAVTLASAGRLGGTGTIGGVVTVATRGTLLGGDGINAAGALTLTANPTLASGSIIELTLGGASTHSSLVLSAGGFSGFQANQNFTLDNLQPGTYDNIITGVASGVTTTGWMVTNGAGYTYSFTDDGSNIDLSVTAVPEPSTLYGALGLIGFILIRERRRLVSLKNFVPGRVS